MILVDSRECHAQYIVKFLISQNIDSDIICLPQETGCDYQIINTFGSIAVQRKVVLPEMIGELDEIMYDIVPRLKNYAGETGNPTILLEENFTIGKNGYLYNANDCRESQMLATSYYGYLETIRKMGVEVICTRDLNQSIWWMIATHNYLATQHFPKHRKCFSVQEQAMAMLMAVPGIGEARAGKALAKSSIRGMCVMKDVPGLTEKQSEKLLGVLRVKL